MVKTNSEVMNIYTTDGVTYLKYKIYENIDYVNHAVSTRHGGVSRGEALGSLNLGYNTKDTKENVTKNYEIFCGAAGFDSHNLVFGFQTHSANVRYVTEDDRGKGIYKDKDYTDVDALITDRAGVALVIHTADCVPITFLDTVNKAIGNAHCGWRGTYQGLAQITLEEMSKRFGTDTKNVICTIGPAICKKCYEVSEELYNDFINKFGYEDAITNEAGKYYLDLMAINKHILQNAGVRKIAVSDLCTRCNSDDLYSHRGLGPERGLMSSVIELR